MIATLSSADALASSALPERTASPAAVPGLHQRTTTELSLSSVATLVLWLSCVTVGGIGLLLPYERPQPAKAAPAPVVFEKLQVELTNAPLSRPDFAPAPFNPSAPPPAAQLAQPQVSQPIAIANASTGIAFAVPVEGPVRLVDTAHAGYTRNGTPGAVASHGPAAPVQSLVFGQGEGRQPAPTYPARASRLGQEGTVTVQFSVDETGRVIAAEAAQPSPWPLLNEAAVRTIRERWRFAAGALRSYEVAILFRLKK